MKPIFLARSSREESRTEADVICWTEYRLTLDEARQLYSVEKRFMAEVHGMTYARVNGKVDTTVEPCSTWEAWTTKRTAEEAVDDVIGDSKFLEATSYHDLHANAVRAVHVAREQCNRKHAVETAEEELATAIQDFEDWRSRENARFKCINNGKEEAAYQKAKERARKRLQPMHDRHQERIREAEKNLEKLRQILSQPVDIS